MSYPSTHHQPNGVEPGGVNAASVDQLEAKTLQFFDFEQRQAAKTLLHPVIFHLDNIVVALSVTLDEHARQRLTFMYGEVAALVGWLILDYEDVIGIHRYWDAALSAAQHVQSEPLLACIQTYMSYAAAEQGDHATAWQLAHTALSHTGDDNRVRAWTAARAAQAAAQLGDHGAAFTNLDVAIELGRDLKPVTSEDATPPWARFVDSAYVWGMIANAFGRMKITSDAFMASVYAGDAITEGQTKARALTLAEIAYAFAAVWQLDEAVWYATQAAELAEKLEATQAKRRLKAMVALLPKPWRVEARELMQRVTAY